MTTSIRFLAVILLALSINPFSAQTITGNTIPDKIALRLFLLDAINQGPAHTAAVVARLQLNPTDASIANSAFAAFARGLDALEETNPSRTQMYEGLDQLTAAAKSSFSELSVANKFNAFIQNEKRNMRVSNIDPGWGPIADHRLMERSMVAHAGHSVRGMPTLEETNPSRTEMYEGPDQLTAAAKSSFSGLLVANKFNALVQNEKGNMRVSNIDPGWGPIADHRLMERSMVAHAGHSVRGMPTFNMCEVAYSTYRSQWFTTAKDGNPHDTVWNSSASVSGDCVIGGFTPPPGTTHTPKIRMTIGSYGVNATGQGVYPTHYLNFGQTATFPMDIFAQFGSLPGDGEIGVTCSVAGLFFDDAVFSDFLFGFYIAPAVTADQYDSRHANTYLGNGWYDYAVTEDIPPAAVLPSCNNSNRVDMTLSYQSFGNGIQDSEQWEAWLSLGLVLYDGTNSVLAQLETTGRSIQDPRLGMALSVPLPDIPGITLPYPCTYRQGGITGYPSVPWPF